MNAVRRSAGKGSRVAARGGWIALVLAVAGLIGAAPPEIVRIRVPADQVSAWFPAGTDLRGLPLTEFEKLVKAAQAGWERQRRMPAARLVRAHHRARWENGLLIGKSTFVVERTGAGPADLLLDPWTPAPVGDQPNASLVRSLENGQTVLRLEAAGQMSVALDWELRARARTEGRAFGLGLPRLDASNLTLDLPNGLVPDGPAGTRQGPAPGPGSDRSLWKFDGPGGLVDLRLLAKPEAAETQSGPALWVGGTSEIVLEGSSASWRVDWQAGFSGPAPRRLLVQLDPGLEAIDVTGTAVAGFQAEPSGTGTQLAIRLHDDGPGPFAFTIQATANLPAEGNWLIPSARPLDALWTGGRTIVRVGTERELVACHQRAGRRVAPRPKEMDDPPPLVFEMTTPESPAELRFRLPSVEGSARVVGQLRLGDHASRFDAQIDWYLAGGRLYQLVVEVPSGWQPDQVRIAGSTETPLWHVEPRAEGQQWLIVTPAQPIEPGAPLRLELGATARDSGLTGPLAAPRARPVGVRISDELWIAHVEPGWVVRPVKAEGLFWVDPLQAISESARPFASFFGMRSGLAWRWIDAAGSAQFERERFTPAAEGAAQTLVTVEPDRLHIDWFVSLSRSDPRSHSVLVGINEPVAAPPEWRLAADEAGPPLPARPLSTRRRIDLGLAEDGSAWELELPPTESSRVLLRAHHESAWTGEGRIPLVVLPAQVRTAGLVVVLSERSIRSLAESSALRILEPAVAWRALTQQEFGPISDREAPPSLATHRRAHAFSYQGRPGRLELQTESLSASPEEGVIQEAQLATRVTMPGRCRNRLKLRVASTRARELTVTLPPGALLERALRDGQTAVPTRYGDAVSISLPAAGTARSLCEIALEFTTESPEPPGEPRLSPERPKFSLPCLALSWEVAYPTVWEVAEVDPALTSADPPPPAWALEPVRAWLGWPRQRTDLPPAQARELLKDFDRRVATVRSAETTLGDWLIGWDGGRWPVVIDRVGLGAMGWGPHSRIQPARVDPRKPGAALSVLRSLGLAGQPVGEVLLITTPAELAALRPPRVDAAELSARVRAAAGTGADVSDRFQSAARWLREWAPESSANEPPGSRQGWAVRRWAEPGWPAAPTPIQLENREQRGARVAAIAVAVLCLGLLVRRARWQTRALALASVLAAGLLASTWRSGELALGVATCALATLALWTGTAFRPVVERGPGDRSSDPALRQADRPASPQPAVAVIVAAILIAGTAAGWAAQAQSQAESEPRILAVLPFEGLPDLDATNGRVLLRLQDYERLQTLAAAKPAPSAHGLSAIAARHRVRWGGDQKAQVVSHFVLWAEGDGPWSWSLPVGSAEDLTAELDGEAVPLRIQDGGLLATVSLDTPGRHELEFARALRPIATDAGQTLRLLVNPVACSHVEVSGAEATRVDLPSARGRIEPRADGLEANLGPVETLEIGRPRAGGADRDESHGLVEGMLIWDIEPAGDRLQARLTFQNPAGTGQIRLALEPGLAIRSAAIPGLVETRWEGTSARPEWVARVEPPLPDGASAQVELWRPLSQPAAPAAAAAPEAQGSEKLPGSQPARQTRRKVPHIDLRNVERFTGVLAFRGLEGWSVQLADAVGAEQVRTESVLKDGLELDDQHVVAGAVRFLRTPACEVVAGPTPASRSIHQSVQVKIDSGRLDVTVDAVLSDRAGRSFDALAQIPPTMNVLQVEADGLRSWSRVAPDRLLLLFDVPDVVVPRRTIRLKGWIPVPVSALSPLPPQREMPIPWPKWSDTDPEPGTLAISSATITGLGRAQGPAGARTLWVDGNTGLVAAGANDPAATSSAGQSGALTFRVDAKANLGRVHWTPEPPRVSVSVQSQLTIHPDSAGWASSVRYQVAGGSTDALYLKLPTAWAESATIEMVGDGYERTSRSDGTSTTWTIRPHHPIWSDRRLVIRSSRPFVRGQALDYPDLVPLGWGTAERTLAVTNASGFALEYEGSPGLLPIEPARLPQVNLTPLGLAPSHAYRVRGESWALRIRAPGPIGPMERTDVPRVVWADLACVLAPDGVFWGEARYEIEGPEGPFLPVVLPGGAEAVRATVDQTPVQPLRGGSGRWLIPLGDGSTRQVSVLWRARPTPARWDGTRPIPLPGIDQDRVPTLLAVYAPATVEFHAPGAILEQVGAASLETERTERLGRRIAALLETVDRSSPLDRQLMAGLFTRFELQARTASRAIWYGKAEHLESRVSAARRVLAEAVRLAGLEEWSQQAQERVGGRVHAPEAPPTPMADLSGSLIPLRLVGQPRFFRSDRLAKGMLPSLRWAKEEPPPAWRQSRRWLETLCTLGACLLVYLAVCRAPEHPRRLAAVTVMLLLGTLALGVIDPLSGSAILGLLAIGRFSSA